MSVVPPNAATAGVLPTLRPPPLTAATPIRAAPFQACRKVAARDAIAFTTPATLGRPSSARGKRKGKK